MGECGRAGDHPGERVGGAVDTLSAEDAGGWHAAQAGSGSQHRCCCWVLLPAGQHAPVSVEPCCLGTMSVLMVNTSSLADSTPARMPQVSMPRRVLLTAYLWGGGGGRAGSGRWVGRGGAAKEPPTS